MPTANKYRAPLIALLILILANLACSMPGDTMVKGEITCTYRPWLVDSWSCTCPLDGTSQRYGITDLQSMDDDTLYGQVCGSALLVQQFQPTRTPTATRVPPTQTATSTRAPLTATLTQTPSVLKPYLTGGFTACDNTARYVNLTIAQDAPPYDPATFKVLFNGQEAACAPAGNTSTVFTCNYPSVYRPPVTIEVLIGGQSVNKFEFPGGVICDPPTQRAPSGGGAEPQPSATTDPSTD